jgi:hypothetical protein
MDLQTFFEIGSFKVLKNEETVLLWEIGSNYSLLSLWSDDVKACRYVQVHMFDELEMENSIVEILATLHGVDLKYKKVFICSAFADAFLVPRKYFAQDSNLLEVVYDAEGNGQFYDFAGQWQLVNFYSMPRSILRVINERFSGASFRHVYTPALKVANEIEAPEQICVHILNKQFRVMVKIDNNLLLMQTYAFAAPMDVIYYLLKICNEFGMSQEQVHLTLSGFIELDSALYKDLYQYFTNISFARHAAIEMPEHDYPQHFFTSLHNLAACVS